MGTRRRWVPIVFGIAVLVVFIGIGAIVAVTAWVQQNLQVEQSDTGDAEREFDAVRRRFANRPPLLEIRDGRPAYVGGREKAAAESAVRLDALHIMVWDPGDGRLARFRLPFWLLRMKSDPIRLSAYTTGMDDRVDLRPEDIERYGPGILLDTGTETGERVLLWTE